jgi:hypothetical protein
MSLIEKKDKEILLSRCLEAANQTEVDYLNKNSAANDSYYQDVNESDNKTYIQFYHFRTPVQLHNLLSEFWQNEPDAFMKKLIPVVQVTSFKQFPHWFSTGLVSDTGKKNTAIPGLNIDLPVFVYNF